MITIETMNAYVGIAKIEPDSRTPRRFASVMRRMKMSEISTLYGRSDGSADVMAKTPATTDTDTVST